MAYYNAEPFGTETQYYGPAITTAMLANINRKKGTQAVKPDQFVPQFERKVQSKESMLQIAQAMTIGMGGRDLRESKDGEDE